MKISHKLIENKINIIKELYSDGKCEYTLRFFYDFVFMTKSHFLVKKIEVLYHFQAMFDAFL